MKRHVKSAELFRHLGQKKSSWPADLRHSPNP